MVLHVVWELETEVLMEMRLKVDEKAEMLIVVIWIQMIIKEIVYVKMYSVQMLLAEGIPQTMNRIKSHINNLIWLPKYQKEIIWIGLSPMKKIRLKEIIIDKNHKIKRNAQKVSHVHKTMFVCHYVNNNYVKLQV